MNGASGSARLGASAARCITPPLQSPALCDRLMLTVIQRLRGGALQTSPPLGFQSYTITANPPLPHTPPTTRRMRQATSNLLLQRSALSLCPVSHSRTRCSNNQTTAMIAEPSPKLIVLLCPIGSKWFLLLFLFVYSPPSLCLLGC